MSERRPLTLQDLEALPGDFLRVQDVADHMRLNPQSLRLQSQTPAGRAALGFPISRLGTRVRIPKQAYIRWARGELPQEYHFISDPKAELPPWFIQRTREEMGAGEMGV